MPHCSKKAISTLLSEWGEKPGAAGGDAMAAVAVRVPTMVETTEAAKTMVSLRAERDCTVSSCSLGARQISPVPFGFLAFAAADLLPLGSWHRRQRRLGVGLDQSGLVAELTWSRPTVSMV